LHIFNFNQHTMAPIVEALNKSKCECPNQINSNYNPAYQANMVLCESVTILKFCFFLFFNKILFPA
jgi:quinol-cytochrome oxidoreductase complex cytochrome b subunit